MDNKNNIATLVFLISLGTLFYLAHRDMKIKRESINKNYKSTIALVINYKKTKSSRSCDYEFYFNGYKINGSNMNPKYQRDDCIGNYYVVEFSSENPNFSNIFLNQQIVDSLEITKAGFKLD